VRAILRGRLVIETPRRISVDTGIVVDNGIIVDVGKYDEIAARTTDASVQDFDGIICPGLINAHTHLELSVFRKEQFQHKDFVDWVMQLVAARTSMLSDDLHIECSNAKRDAEERGTAFFVNVGNDYELNSSFGKNQLFQFEQIGINDSNADRIFSRAEPLVNQKKGGETALAIHAPYSVSPELMRKIKAYNNGRNSITSIHLAETSDEVEFIRTGKGRVLDLLNRRVGDWKFDVQGLSPVKYVDSLGILDEKTLCVHCVFVDDDDIKILRDRESAVAICVRSNRELSGKVPPVKKFVESGIKVLLGTDSKASSPDIDMFEEVATFYKEFHGFLDPARVFGMATSDAADFLSIDNSQGAIAPGKRASLVYVPFNGKVEDAFEFLATEAHGKTKAVDC